MASSESNSSSTALTELISFLSPATRVDVRRNALALVTSLGGNIDGSAGQLFTQDDCRLGKALLHLYSATASDRHLVLAALTNFTARSLDASALLLDNLQVLFPPIEKRHTTEDNKQDSTLASYLLSPVPAKLFCNLSRHAPHRVDEEFKKRDNEYEDKILNWLSDRTTIDASTARLVGFVLLNVSTLSHVRKQLAERRHLDRVIALLNQTEDTHKREIAAQLLRNLAFEDDLHSSLLDSDDAFLSALLSPLLDESAELSDDEMVKLPLRLQYFEGKRDVNAEVRQAVIEAMYQICATKLGREKLRAKGVYAVLRELDKAQNKEQQQQQQQAVDGDETDKKAGNLSSLQSIGLAEEEHTLHALIGILIRYESEMDVDPTLHTIRHLE